MTTSSSQLERRAFSLGAANALDYGLQFLLPIVLARALDVESFGHYRLFWLAVMTATTLVSIAMPQSLYFFLPRSEPAQKRLYINQTLVFLCAAGAIAAVVLSPLNPWLPQSMQGLAHPAFVFPLFLLLWTVATVIDVLPTVEEQVRWQAKTIMGLSVVRSVSLSAVAIATGSLAGVLYALLGFVLLKLWLLYWYVRRYHGWHLPLARRETFTGQVKHAAPFGFSGALYGLRGQVDQWVAATLFTIGQFAAFSVSSVIGPLVTICRQSVNHVFLPSMSRLQADGDARGMLALNSRANVMVGALVYPVLAFAFVFAEEVVLLIYTSDYLEAAPVMRLYIFALAAMVVELSSIMWLLKEGSFALRVNTFLLGVSIGVSWVAAKQVGLVGAALGSVVAIYIDRFVTLRRISRRVDVPVASLQDWRSLAMLVAMSIASGAPAWVLSHHLAAYPPIVRLAAGGATMAIVYGVLFMLLNADSRFMTLPRRRAAAQTPLP